MNKLIIKTWRGLVSEVFINSDEDFEVYIADEDSDIETTAEDQLGLLGAKNMKQIY